tara:strand:- start:8861 stop:9334 length:474 start_codon:yes stop_codon:yes gene_type:complete
MSVTPTYTDEEVRKLLVAQIQTLEGFKHSRHLFDGVKKQGAVIGDRTFDVRVGVRSGTMWDKTGCQWSTTIWTIRMRHRSPPLASAEDTPVYMEDRQTLPQRLLSPGFAMPGSLIGQTMLQSIGAPVENTKGFLDTDVTFTITCWIRVTRSAPDMAA